MRTKVWVCWKKEGRKPENYGTMRARLSKCGVLTVNKESLCEATDEEMALLRGWEKEGLVEVRFKDA